MSQETMLATERAALGAALVDPMAADKVCEVLVPGDFSHPFHREVFSALAQLTGTRAKVDPITVSNAMRGGSRMSQVFELTSTVTSGAHASYHAGLILAASKLRSLAALGTDLSQLASSSPATTEGADHVLEELRVRLDEITARTPGHAPIRLADAEPELLERILSDASTPIGASTGFPDIDDCVGGLRDGEMIVLAARPGVGKSLLAANMAENICFGEQPLAVLFLSLEMSSAQLYRRYLFARSQVPSSIALGGRADSQQKEHIQDAHAELKRASWYVHHQASMSAQRVHALARRFKNKHGPSLIIIDYLQLMSGPGSNRTETVTNLSAAMKSLAVDLSCPVLVLSQLNRGAAEERERDGNVRVRIPTLSDLRDSGAIEQDADVVCFLARDVLRRESHPVEFVCAKNRPATTGRTQLLFKTEGGPRFESIIRTEAWKGQL